MNFDNYRYFAAAAEELNFTKAARKLFMTQQALSKQIDKMEKEYNTRLFNRETPMSLTPAGECMYRHVCRILDNERQMRAELDAVLGQESRNLVVGVSYFPQQYPDPADHEGVFRASSGDLRDREGKEPGGLCCGSKAWKAGSDVWLSYGG